MWKIMLGLITELLKCFKQWVCGVDFWEVQNDEHKVYSLMFEYVIANNITYVTFEPEGPEWER